MALLSSSSLSRFAGGAWVGPEDGSLIPVVPARAPGGDIPMQWRSATGTRREPRGAPGAAVFPAPPPPLGPRRWRRVALSQAPESAALRVSVVAAAEIVACGDYAGPHRASEVAKK